MTGPGPQRPAKADRVGGDGRARAAAVRASLAGILLLAAALAIFFFSIAAVDYSRTKFFDLDPVPDATEYMAAAVSLAERGEYRIQVADELHPPRYPPGYSLLMQPFLWRGSSPVEAPFATSRAFGLLTILLVFAGVCVLRNPFSAGLGALLVAAFPMFIILSRSPLSDMTGGFFCLLSFFLLWVGLERHRPGLLLAGAWVLGLSTLIRVSNLLLLGLLPAAWILNGKRQGIRLLMAWVAGILPLLAYQHYTFGSVLATGYSYWIPPFGQPWNAFAAGYFGPNLSYLLGEALQQEAGGTPAWIFGLGSYFDVTFFLLLGAVLIGWRQGRVPIGLGAAVGLYGFLLLFYFFQDARLMWPLFLLLFPVLACGLGDQLPGKRRPPGWSGVLLLLLLLSHLTGYPNRWANPQLLKYLRTDKLRGRAERYELCLQLRDLRGPGQAVVFTDLEMPYVSVLAGRPGAVYPLLPAHSYRFNPAVFRMEPAQVRAALERSLEEKLEVWALVGGDASLARLDSLLPLPDGFTWKRRAQGKGGHGLALAVNRASRPES